MYGNDFAVPDEPLNAAETPDYEAALAEHAAGEMDRSAESHASFDALIAADQRIEPRDDMPQEYRDTLIRQIAGEITHDLLLPSRLVVRASA